MKKMEISVKLKDSLLKKCLQGINERIEAIKSSMLDAQDAANDETKSSAGDKYETTRSMMQLDNEMFQKQMNEALKTKSELLKVSSEVNIEKIKVGCLVLTTQATYFLIVGLGKIDMDNRSYFVVSPHAPVGLQLMDKKVGDEIVIAGKTAKILQIV